MELVRIKDHVQYAYTYDEGQVIFELIAPALERGEEVNISFEGFPAVPSSFVNAALLQLADRISIADIKARVHILHSTRFINEMIIRGFETAEAKQQQRSDPAG